MLYFRNAHNLGNLAMVIPFNKKQRDWVNDHALTLPGDLALYYGTNDMNLAKWIIGFLNSKKKSIPLWQGKLAALASVSTTPRLYGPGL